MGMAVLAPKEVVEAVVPTACLFLNRCLHKHLYNVREFPCPRLPPRQACLPACSPQLAGDILQEFRYLFDRLQF